MTDTGGVLVSRIEYTPISDTSVTEVITDCVSLSANKSIEIKNNILSLNLKNLPLNYDGTNIRGEYIKENGIIKFESGDRIKLYAKMTDDPDDVTDYTNWVGTDTLIGDFSIQEFQIQQETSSCRINVKTTDSAYILFNKVWTYDYGTGNWTMPGAFRHAIRNNTENIKSQITKYQGTQNDTGVEYAVEANFKSEAGITGKIQDYRSTLDGGPFTRLDGGLASGNPNVSVLSTTGFKDSGTLVIIDGDDSEHIAYTGRGATTFTGCTRGIDDTIAKGFDNGSMVLQGFPVIGTYKIWKAMFEWFSDLIQTTQTNYEDELGAGSTPFYNRAFLFYLDKDNKMNLLPADDTVDLELDLGEEDFKGFKLTKSIFDSINFVIYSCGDDMLGNGITWYYYNDSSNIGTLKMKYQPLTDISVNLIQADIKINSTRDTTKTDDIYKQFPSSGSYPLSDWGFKKQQNKWEEYIGDTPSTSIANDSEYNSGLRSACKWEGLQRAINLTIRKAGLRYKGTIALDGQILNPGDLIKVTNSYCGLNIQLLRVVGVTHQINNNNFNSILEVEEDEQIIGE